MIYLFGISISFFLAVLLIGKKNKSKADRILAVWLVFIGLHLTCFYLYFSGNYLTFPYYLGFELPLPFVHGPFLYLYTGALTSRGSGRAVSLLHFAPFLLGYIPLAGFLASPLAHKIDTYQNQGAGYETIMNIMNTGIIVSGITYVTLSLLRLNRHRKRIEDQFSYTDRINLAWLRYLIAGLGVIWLPVIWGQDNLTFFLVVLFVFFIGYFGIRQVDIFAHRPPAPGPVPDEPTGGSAGDMAAPAGEEAPDAGKIKYEKSGLKEGDLERIHRQLRRIMAQEKLFADPELTLSDLAGRLEVHPNYLSQVINTAEGKSFFDYINELRVAEFKRIVARPGSRQFTLLSLAFDCGFNSKTAFNRNFKKSTGLTPSEYLAAQHIHLP